MKNAFFSLFFVLFALSINSVNGQQGTTNQLGFLQLTEKDVPVGYQFITRLKCQSSNVTALYKNIASFENELGKVVHTNFQTLKANKETGTILYFQFENAKDSKAFLDNYLWGNEGKPTIAHPEEYAAYGKFLVIWSTGLNSEIKKASQNMIERLK